VDYGLFDPALSIMPLAKQKTERRQDSQQLRYRQFETPGGWPIDSIIARPAALPAPFPGSVDVKEIMAALKGNYSTDQVSFEE